MNADPNKAREIFLQALKRSSAQERASLLENACAGDQALRQHVDILIDAHEHADSFLEKGVLAVSATTDQPPSEQPGTLIGPYKLLEQIGEGGMGVVYVAEQMEPVRRRVALKIIKPGMDTKQVIARFEAERQALAMMDHPNIAKVLDAGATETGRPYFVMELVRGLPITEYCDKARLSPRQRLELIIDVCHAVQHAHQKGIIHRDLKPSNVMITVHDGRPIPKVIDFGVAKAVGQQLTERTVYTAHTQLVGTPLYMSPEQADFSSQDVDTRSDVYSLGVLLYELLTGQTPFDKEALHKAGFDEMRRIIREDDPPRPSRRISTLGAQASSTVSQQRGVDQRHLSRIVCGELDWIVMKSLEKDRTRRYESPSALATDIQHYLSDEPVLACPPTAMYRFQKFARKHKASLTTAAAIAVCLILGTTVSAWQAARATTAEALAVANAQKATANEQQANANAAAAKDKAQEANQERDEAQKQRDEVKALADKLAAKEEDLQRTLYADHIRMAQGAWESGDVRAMSQLLEQHVPKDNEQDRRGFEWEYLNRLANVGPLLSISTAHVSRAKDQLKLSPDRTRLIFFRPAERARPGGPGGKGKAARPATPASPPTLQSWNLLTGQEEFSVELSGFPDGDASRRQPSPEFTPDSAHLVLKRGHWDSAEEEYVPEGVEIWDTRTGKQVFELSGAVKNVLFSPNNKLLAISKDNQSIKLWDLETGQLRLTLQGELKLPSAVTFSPDGNRLAAADSPWDKVKEEVVDGAVIIWDVQTGEQLKSFKTQMQWISQLVFSPDGQQIVAGSEGDSPIKVWDARSGKDVMTIRWDIAYVNELVFNSDGTRLMARGYKKNNNDESGLSVGYARLWNAQTGQELLSVEAGEIQFSPDGKRAAIGSYISRRTKVFDAISGQVMLSGKVANGDVAFSPDGKRLAAMSGVVRVWDLESGDETNHINRFEPSYLLGFSQDGKRLVGSKGGGTAGGVTEVWDVDAERQSAKKIPLIGVFALGPSIGDKAVISPDFTRIAGVAGKTVKLFDAQSGQEIRTLIGHDQFLNCVAFSPDGKRLASSDSRQGADPGTVKVWDVDTGKELFTIADLPHRILLLKFSPDGKKLAGSPADNTVTVWDASSGREQYSLGSRNPQIGDGYILHATFAFSRDGSRLAWQGMIWNAETGERIVTLKPAANTPRGGFAMTDFSPNGKRVVGGTGVGSPVLNGNPGGRANGVWDAETGEMLFTTSVVNGDGEPIFSPDGKRLAGGGKIWDAETGQFLLSLTSDGIRQVAFSADGHRLAVVRGKEVTIYDATPLPERP